MGGGIKDAIGGAADTLTGGLFSAFTKDSAGDGKSAQEMKADAKRKADKETTRRRAAIARNKTIFSESGEPDNVFIPKANIFNKKTLG